MVRQLKPSPLPDRIASTAPLRHWLWSAQRAYDGVLVPTDRPDSLLPFLQQKGTLQQINDLYCFTFDAPVSLNPAQLGPALPLRKIGSTTLSTYDLGHVTPKDSGQNRLHAVLHGQPVSYDLHTAVAVDPMQFWDLGGLRVLEARPLPDPTRTTAPKPQPHMPRQSAVFKDISEAKPIYDDIRDAVNAEKTYKMGDYIRKGGRLFRTVLSSIVLIFLGCVTVLAAMNVLTLSARGGLFGLIVVGCIIYALWWLFAGGRSVGVTGTKGTAKKGAGQSRYRGPGMFDRLKSWALWNTKMGDRLRADIARHINEVSRMIEKGDIDRALKRALALGAEQAANDKKRGHGPTSLPKARAALDMDLSGMEAPTASILNDNSFAQMATQYLSLIHI